ncbi:MAG: hypothetical protein NZ519_12060 [Bacteroidia bacterium]|nr:hypothetical protein [Bacteroidia bacterium]
MGVPLWAFRLCSCPQGRRATGYVQNAPDPCARTTKTKKTNLKLQNSAISPNN